MKKKWCLIVMLVIVTLLNGYIRILRIFPSSDYTGRYDIRRLDSGSNLSTSNTDLYFATFTYSEERVSCIYHYSISEDRLEKLVEKEGKITNFSVREPWIYYSHTPDITPFNLIKYNISTGEEETIFISEDWLVIEVFDDCLLYHTVHDFPNNRFLVCPADGDPYEDSIDLSTIFTEEDRSGNPQYAYSHGLIVERSYDVRNEIYDINSIRQADGTGKVLFNSSSLFCVSSYPFFPFHDVYIYKQEKYQNVYLNGEKITLSKSETTKRLWYQEEGEDRPHDITCLSDKRFEFSDFRECLLTTQGDEIIGLLTVYPYDRDKRKWRLVSGSISQVLFRLNPKTGESSILYDSQQQSEAIIGYDGELVYLVHNRKVYSWSPEDQKPKKLFKLLDRDAEQYVFDWQGDYLIVYCGQDLERVYKVK